MHKLSFIDRFHHWRRKMRWNKQYKKGKWKYLNDERESSRYHKIVDYIKTYATTNPSILDLGAGEAVLNQRLNKNEYKTFFNVDFSSASIDIAKTKNLENSVNLVADIHTYTPEETFDVIVFNEAFYYVHNDLKQDVLDRFIGKLNSEGILIVSIYKEGTDCWQLINNSSKIQQLNFEKVDTDRESTYWKVGVYKKV
ncbi:class I SAM-dependent methyltransferase [Winogradskyella schleiferi]|uniref:class I SAM-dependent methyltransferase n=1 Tax=Winogradskyella schleiferi TaxID=2686078 RepID=UPI0015BAB3D5|nr:class I SAM-dependent methyltransferase [Winogradskyella schleiferi]